MNNRKSTTIGKLFCLLLWLVVSTAAVAQQKQQPVSKNKMLEALKKTQNTISFIENKGQWSPEVKVAGNTNIGNMYITNDHIHFVSFEKEEKHEGEETEEDEAKEAEELEHQEVHGWGIYLDGSNKDYTISKQHEMPTRYNYLIGNTYNASDVASYGEVTMNNIYEGIDLRIYSQDQHVMEFDWLVNAGSDFSNIKMRFKGQEGLSVDENGILNVKLEFDAVKFDIPEAYQIINGKKVMVKMAFQINGDVATFKAISKIDNRYDLVIDPSLKWGTWFDNNSDSFDEYLFAVDLDNQGNVYCGGNINVQLTSGAGNYINPATLFGFDNSYAGSVDGIIYKLRFDGAVVLKVTYFGTSANDRLYGLSLSPDKSTVFVCGLTAGTLPTGSTTAFDAAIATSEDGFVGVLDAATLGTPLYTTYIGGTGNSDEMVSIRALSNNSFVVGGHVNAALSTTTPNYILNAYDAAYSGGNEMYIAKFTNFNTLTFGTYIGGTGDDQVNDIQIFSDGYIAFSGASTDNASFPALFNNAANAVANTTGSTDGVIGVLPPSGGTSVQMLSRFGGTGADEFYGLTIDAFDTLYVTGFTSSTNFYLGPNATAANRFQTTKGTGQDGFVGKLPRTGWNGGATDPWAATYFGGGGDDRGNTLRTYTPYTVMVFGETQSDRYPFNKNISDGGALFDSTANGGWDIFYQVLGTDLKTQYFATLVGGSANDYLGQTGTPHGSNHFQVEGDSLICLGTTVHSSSLTPNPIGGGGFDLSQSTNTADIHLIFKWRIGILFNFDYGDAPSSYGNPNHVVFNSLKIGSTIDKEDFPLPSYKCDSDDRVGTIPDDEDGIAVSGPYNNIELVQDTSTRFTQAVSVTNSTGLTAILAGWIDFNRDGDFLDANEVDTVLVPSGATSATLRWTGYNTGAAYFNLTNDTSYMRLRLTTQSSFFVTNPSPTANAANGEVEDYLVIRYHCVNLTSAIIDTNGTSTCGSATGSIVITNDTLIAGVQYGVYYSKNGGPLQGPVFYTTTGSGISGTLTISGLTAGTYTAVQVFHPTNPACGFTLPGSYVITNPATPPAPLTATATPNPICTGNTVQLDATTNQVGTITWSWTGPVSFTAAIKNPTRLINNTNLGGNYFVTQTINGCTSSPASVNLVVSGTPVIATVTGTNPTTCLGTQGTITITGLLASQTYTVNYTKGGVAQGPVSIATNASGNIIITGLTAGTYTAFQVSIAGCSSAVNNTIITLTDPSAPPAPLTATAVPNPICTGNTVQLDATTNQVGTITWAWTGPAFTAAIKNPTRLITSTSMGGSYSVTQTINNCTSPATSVTLVVNATPVITSTSSTNPLTCGGTTGTILLNGLNASTAYSVTYTKNGGSPTTVSLTSSAGGVVTITGLTAGSYTNISVTLSGCPSAVIAGPIALSDPAAPSAPAPTSNTPVCTGGTISLFTSTVSGATYSWTGVNGNGSYTSSLQNPTRSTATAAMGGSYCLTITVANCTSSPGCTNVVVNTTPAIGSTSSTNPTTCGGADGTITLNGLSATTAYSVAYSKNGTAQGPFIITSSAGGAVVITGLTLGSYTNFTVTINGCTSAPVAGPIVLSDPSTPATPTASSNSPVCSGNTINLSTALVSGATYSWTGVSGNGTFTSNLQNPTRGSATVAMGGSYCVAITVANCTSLQGCTNVVVNPTPVVTSTGSTNPTSCAGNDGTILLNGLTANTTYSVRYNKDGIPQGPFTLTANGAGVVTIPNLIQGNYTLIVVTLNGCQSSPVAGPLNILDPTPPAAPTLSSNSPVCSGTGNTLTLFASGNIGASYSWTGPSGYTSSAQNPTRANATVAMSGSYCATQTVSGCLSDPACVTVIVNATPSITSSTSNNPTTCGGSNGTIVLSGLNINTTYTVNYLRNLIGQGPFSIATNGSGVLTITGLNAGSYTNITVALAGCTSAAEGPFTLSDPATPSAPSVSSNTDICSGVTLSLFATGQVGATYSWTGPSGYTSSAQNPTRPSSTVAMSGSYCATQTVANCNSASACTPVVVNATPTFTLFASSNPTTCGGSQGTITLSGLNTNVNYSVTYTKSPPGTGQGPFVITSNGSGQLTITGLTAGSYSTFVVTLVSTGCSSVPVTGPVTLTDPATPSAPGVSSNTPVCSGNTITLSATGQVGATYSWTGQLGYSSSQQSPSIGSSTTAMSGNYCATQTVAGCTSPSACTFVTVNQTPGAPTPGASPNPVCTGGTLTLTATGVVGATFNWTYPDASTATGTPIVRNNVVAGMAGLYSVTQTVSGCTSLTAGTVNVTVNQTPGIPSASNNGPVCVGNTIQLNTSTVSGASYSWTGPASFSSSSQNPTIINAVAGNAGTYNISITVNGCTSTSAGTTVLAVSNCTPIAVRDVYSNCAVSTITGNILTNDIDPSGNGIQIITPNICGTFSGTITQNSGGGFTYTPPVAFNGVDSICYKVCSVNFPSRCDTGIAVFDYTCVNLPPVAVDDNYTVDEDDTLTGTVTNNDYDPDGGIITVNTTPTCNPQHGTVTLLANGNFTYIPVANYNGPDTFCYQICDNGVPIKCANATVVITVIPVNDPPITVPDTTITTPEDTPITVCIPVDDVEVNSQSHNVNICGNPVNGTITSGPSVNNPLVPRTVCLTYTPNANFNGNDSICLIICDNGTPTLCDTTHIHIIVTPVNDPPVAVNDNYSTNEDVTLVTSSVTGVRNNDSDPADGLGATSLTVTTTPIVNTTNGTLTLNGNGSFTYVPVANFCGSDSFQYRVCDSGTGLPANLCDTATAYITIVCVNDPPVVVDTPITTCEDCGPITVCIPVTDPDVNQTSSVAATFCGPNSGSATTSLVLNTLCVTYTSNTNFNGLDSICVIVCDNGTPVLCDTTHITITVTPVNDPPVAVNDNYTTNEDVSIITSSVTGVRNNDNDNADGNPVTSLTVTTTPIVNVAHGTLTLNSDGSFTYVPNANYFGTDSFQYVVCDNGTPLPSLCNTATAYITIVPVNDPPVVADTTVAVPEDSVITVCIPISDAENGTQQHTASFCDAPDNGVITSGPIVDNGTNTVCITYHPNSNFNGNDSICLTICDNGSPVLCDNTTIRIIVTPVNDPPIATNDNYTTNEDTPLNVPVGTGVRVNDNDNADGNPVTSLSVTTSPLCGPSNGTVTLNSNGSFLYTPNAGYNGVDSFCYRVCDSGTPLPSLCDTAVAYITINQVNDPPVIVDTPITTCEDCPITVCIPFSDADVVDIHSQSLLCNPVNGTVSNITISDVTNTLCFTYQGYTNIHGSDSLCIVVCDNGSPVLCDTTHITITITPVNDPPYADTIYVVTYENIPVGVNVASATGDLEGDPLSYTYGGVIPNSGTYYISGNGAIVFVPNPGFTGTVTIPYTVCDLSPYPVNILCDAAAIVVTVLPTGDTLNNHAPVASNDYVTTPLNTAVVVNELANDYDPDGDPLQVTIIGLPSHGSVTVNPNGTVNYTPNSGYFGFDTIHYVICDPAGTTLPRPLCDDAYIIIYISTDSIAVVNDAPVAVDDFANICADASTIVNVLLNDYDPNGDALTSVTVIQNVSNGTLTNASLGIYTYDPNNNFAGNDTFVYRVCDNGTPSLCDTAVAIITVHPTPVITPSVASLTTCSGNNVDITFTSSVVGAVISWSGSNGTSGTGDIHTVLTNTGTASQVVTYTVSASTGFGCGSAVLTIAVTVTPRPVVTYTISNTVFCSGQQVVVNLFSNIAGTTFTWSGSNGSSGTGNIITDNPTNTGIIDSTVTYTINSSFNGCSGTPVNVSVIVKPQPVITATPLSQTICSGTPITIMLASNVSGTSVIWTGSNGNSGNAFTINDSPVNNGVSNLTVTYSINGSANGCPATTVFATVLVRPRVVADAGSDKSVTSCAGSCISIGGSPTGSGGNGTFTYAWSPSDSLSATNVANPNVCNLTSNTLYTVTVTDGNNCSATDAVAITVVPSSLTAEAGSGGALCLGSGDSVMLGGFPTAVGGTPTYSYNWSPTTGLNLTNPANPEAFPASNTMYYLTVTDALGCISVDSALVRVYPTLVVNAGNDTSVCSTFAAQLGGTPTASGGSGTGYTYVWSPSVGISNVNAANPTATPAVLTTYSVYVADNNGCTATDNVVVTVRQNPIANAGPDKTIVTCSGDSTTIGDIPAVTSGTGPYTYSWTPATGLSSTSVANPVVKGILATTTYTLSVTDANGCVSTDNVTVNVIANTLQAQAGPDEAVCSNNNCVQVGGIPTAVGGTPPYVYDWSNGGSLSDSVASNPLACPGSTTTYTVVITDSKGCTATDAETVTVNPSPSASAGPDTSVCAGSSIAIGGSPSATGGTPGYTYSWNPTTGLSIPNVANPSASPTVVTTYQLIVTDTKNCAALDEVTVTPRQNPVVDAGADKMLVSCFADTAFMVVNVSGGTSPYTFVWSPAISLNSSTVQNPYVTGLTTTTSYQVNATDIYGCSAIDFVVVNVVQSTLQADAGNDGTLCANSGSSANLGGIPTAVGGTSPYAYTWASSPAGFSSSLSNPAVSPTVTTTYYVTVIDSKGCSSVDSVKVNFNPAPSANAGTDTTMCSGFCVTVGGTTVASGGTGPYQYLWSPTIGLNANNNPNPLACPLVTTTYNVVVTDSNGCQSSDAITITIRSNPIANAGVDQTLINCGSDSVTIGGSPAASGGAGGYTYTWSPATGLSSVSSANPIVKGLNVSQLYTLVATDVNGCSAEDAVVVNVVPSTLTAEAGSGGSYCQGSGGTVTVGGIPTAVGGTPSYNYAWSGGLSSVANPVANPDTTTTYYVTITDSKGCIAVDSVTITVHPSSVACAGADTAICLGTSVQLGCGLAASTTASGGTAPYTYLWAPPTGLNNSTASNPIATPIATTNYTVRVVDAYGCTASDGVTVTVRPLPVVDAGADNSLIACSADSVQIGGSPAASGGSPAYTYDWSPNAGISDTAASNPYVSHLGSSATYTLVVTDTYGCSGSDQVTINVNNSTLVAEAGNNVAFCQGAAVSITLGGSPTAVSNGTGPYTYLWTPGTGLSSTSSANPIATPLATTTYSVVVTDAAGCIASDTVRISINPRPVVNAGLADTVCAGTATQIGGSPTASGGTGSYTYSWNLGLPSVANPIINPIATLTYVVTVTDSLGCSNNGSVTIRVNQNPIANAGADQTVVSCESACVTIGGSPTGSGGGGGYLYAWAPATGINNTGLSNPTTCSLSQSLTYGLTVTDANGCTAVDQVLVNVTQSTLAADAGNDKRICAGQPNCVTIGGINAVSGGTLPYSISWSPVAGICNSNVIPNPDVNPTDTTTYVLLVTDAQGCIAVDSMVLYANPAVTASVSPDTAICQGGSALLGSSPTGSGGTSPFTYSWNPGSGLASTTSANPVASPSSTTTYCVTVTDAVGCSSSTCQTVTVNAGVTADAGQDRTITSCPGAFTILGGSPTGTGGSNNYSYSWSPSANLNGSTIPNPIAINLTVTTTFTVTVTDNTTGCFSTDQVVVTVNQSNLAADAGINRVYCANSAACVQIGGNPTAVGGQPTYIYQWAAPAGGGNINDPSLANPCVAPLNTTQYFVTVTDQLGCYEVDSMTVVVSPFIVVNAGVDTLICTGTSIVLGGNPLVVGGTTPYTYTWSVGAFPSSAAHPTATPASNTSYTLVVTDSLGCSSSDVVNVALRALPTANAGPDATITACSADSAIIGGTPTASGTIPPYTYSWNPPVALDNANASNPVVQNLGFTTLYTVTVVDTFGCSATDQTQVTVLPNTLFTEAGNSVGSLCSNVGGCVTLGGNPTVTGGLPTYTYNWLGGVNNPTSSNPTACPTSTTTYTVIVTDQDGCQASDTVQVVVNTPPNASISGLNSTYCVNAGNVTMTGSPAGGTFSGPGVTGNIFQPASVGAGFYCIYYSYTNPSTGCSDDTSICVTVNPLPAVTSSGFAPAYCKFDAPVTLVGSPVGGTFTGSPGLSGANGETFNPATATVGNNVITYTYADPQTGCSNTYIFVINVKAAPSIDVTASTDTSCQGASVTFTPTFSFDVFNIVWSLDGGGNLGAGLNPFTYTPTTADYCVIATAINTPNGCVSRDTICGHVNQPPVANDDIAETCEEVPVPIQVTVNDTDPEGNTNIVTVITTNHGTSTLSGNVISYTSNVDYFGSDTITYQLCNTNCVNACDTGTVIVNVCPVNDPPVITDVVDTIYINTSDTVCPPIVDVDDALNTLTVTTFDCDTINGTITVVNGCIVYVPTTDWTGTQVICVSVCDTSGACDTGTVTVVVIPSNNPPIGQKVNVTTCQGTAIGVNVASATTDPDGNLMTYSYGSVTGPGVGTWVITGNGSGVFVSNTPGYYTIPYYLCDISNIPVSPLCDTNEIVVHVVVCDSTNTPPVATDDEVITTINTPIVVNELANDYDADGDPLNVTILCGPSLGGATATLNANNTVSYTSPVIGIDTICYSICDPSGACDTAIIVIHVNTVVDENHPPVAVDDFATTTHQTQIDIAVQGNDSDPDGNSITTTSIPNPPTGGTATINPDGTINYVPTTANAYDPDTFTYVICDNGNPVLCDTATVVVYIINSVVAVDECFETGYSHPIVIDATLNDFDPEIIDSFWVSTSVNLPNTLGSSFVDPKGLIHYIPRPDTCGFVDTFAYILVDEAGAIDTGYICVNILCCPPPVAVTDSVAVIGNDSIAINVILNDTISGPNTVNNILVGPLHGTAYFTDSITVMYVPNTGYCGYDTFSYAGENICGFDTGVVIVNVICNTKPVAANDTQTICRLDTLTFNPMLNDVDADGNALNIAGIGTPSSSGLLTLLALTNNSVTVVSTGVLGDVTVDYYICDNGLPVKCDTATIFIHIDACTKPVIDDIYDTINICANTNDSICIQPYVHLSGNYTWTINSMCAPQNGTLTNSTTCFNYVPNTNFFGNDTFCVIVCSNIGICDTAQIVITTVDCIIQAVDEPCDLDTTIINTPITLDVLANDIIPYAADTTVSLIVLPSNGSAVVNANNTVTYTPNANYKGTEQFSYLVCASTGTYIYCDTANICITVVDTTQPCYIPNGFSPNGDDANDEYVIPCNERSPKATLRVFNRWGVEVWFSEGAYKNDWGGKNMQGTDLPDGTYYIIYEYNDGTNRREAKFVVIQR